jgi:cell division septation protein DedD
VRHRAVFGGKIAQQVIRKNGTVMAVRQTEIYQPSKVAADYDPMEEEDLASHRLPRFIVVALLGLAGIATVIWFGYERGVERGGGEIVVVGPPPGPVRTRPDDPGGAPQQYAGLKVYEPPKTPEADVQSSRLSPVSSGETEFASANETSDAEPPSSRAVPPAQPGGAERPEYLQIGAFPTRELARKAFQRFRELHGDLAMDLSPDIKKADLGEKGVWYRLRIGPFAGKAAAAQSCEKMKKEGVTCLIAAR